jgi:SNF2 family DNA or RNA helicase
MVKPPLKEFQRENVDWIRRVKRGLLADEPGLGKSRSALEGFAGAERVLIVAPSLVLQSGVWDDEVGLWGDDDTRYFAAPYSMLNDRKATGKGSGTRPINRLRKEWRGHWDAVIVDEAHYIKGRETSWTKATRLLSRNCDNMLLMTGTPIPNWAHEVFTLLQMIHPDEGKRGQEYGAFWRWAKQWFDCSPSRFSQGNPVVGELLDCTPKCLRRDADDPCEHYLRFAAANFGDRYMRHLRADHLDLPPLTYEDVHTPMDPVTANAYAELRRDFATSIDDNELLAWSQGAKNVMLDKMTTSPWLLTKQGEPRGGKFEQLRKDLIKRDAPTLVLGHYQDTVDACAMVAETLGKRAGFIHGRTSEKQNIAAIKAFKQGKLDVLAGSLETMAEGLTLTIADTAIFVERSYKPSRNIQATYRIHRMGQTKACVIRRYLTPKSVDTNKETLLNTKTDRQMRTLRAAELVKVL